MIATGYFGSPNMLNVPGENLPHVTHPHRAEVIPEPAIAVLGDEHGHVPAETAERYPVSTPVSIGCTYSMR